MSAFYQQRCICCRSKIPRGEGWLGMFSRERLCADCGPGRGCYALIEKGSRRWIHRGTV